MGEVTLLDIDRAGADPDVDADSWIGHVVFSRWLACTASKLHAMALQQLRGKADLTILTLCPMTGLFEVSIHPSPYSASVVKSTLLGNWKLTNRCERFASMSDGPLPQQFFCAKVPFQLILQRC